MATFLTTPRMSPELRARVERSVSPRARARHGAKSLGLPRIFASGARFGRARLLPLLALIVVGALGAMMVVHDRRATEAERKALLDRIEERRAGLPRGHETFVAATSRFIAEIAKADDAADDVVDAALRAPGALDQWLARPAVYIRGPAAELGDEKKLPDAASASIKDAFLLCLMKPPASASEHDLLGKVRGVYFGGSKVDDQTANVQRLVDARLGLAVLEPGFEAMVRTAEEQSDLLRLRKRLEGAPFEPAKKAAGAELLIVVADGANVVRGRSGEARIALVDLASGKVLLRVRRRAAEQGSSAMATLHRPEMEACSLALSARHSISDGSAEASLR